MTSDFFAVTAPDGGACEDGESVYITMEDEHGQRLRLRIHRGSLSAMHAALYQAEAMGHEQDRSLGREMSATVDLCDDPRVYSDQEAGISWLDLRKNGQTIARAALDLDAAIALAQALTNALQGLHRVRSKPN